MLRLGHLKALVTLGEVNESNTSERLEEELFKIIGIWNQKQDLDNQDYLYLEKCITIHNAEKTLNQFDITKKDKKGKFVNNLALIDTYEKPNKFALQDLYIFDQKMPSHLGTITEKNFDQITKWGTAWNLVEPSNYKLTEKGYLLKMMMKNNDVKSPWDEYIIKNNPYIIGKEKILFNYIQLQQDGSVIRKFLPHLIQTGKNIFDRTDAGEILTQIFKDLLEEGNLDYEETQTLYKLVNKLIKQKDKEDQLKDLKNKLDEKEKTLDKKEKALIIAKKENDPNLKMKEDEMYKAKIDLQEIESELKRENIYTRVGAKAMHTSPRLEILVDLGLLSKRETKDRRSEYFYYTNNNTIAFAEAIKKHNDLNTPLENILNNNFADIMNKTYGYNAKPIDDDDIIFDYLRKGYEIMKTVFELATIEECVIYALSNALESKLYFEISDATQALQRLSTKKPDIVSTHVNNYGEVFAFRIKSK